MHWRYDSLNVKEDILMGRNAYQGAGSRVLLSVLLLHLASGPILADQLPQPAQAAFDQMVVARASAERALDHIAYLSETIGPRLGGMESEWQGADYIASTLESYGYAVEMQPFPVPDRLIGSIELPSGERWQMAAAREGLITGDEPVVGELLHVVRGLHMSDFPPETPGKIVLMKRASTDRLYRRQVLNAVAAGAIGVILFIPVSSPGDYGGRWRPVVNETDVPVLGAAWIEGVWLKEMLAEGPVNLHVWTKWYENLESVNVIGSKPATSGDDDAEAVLVTAHLDSVPGAPGANDNASGVAMALELARTLRNYNTDKELRVVLFGSEERGLIGSRHYVAQLSDAELERILAVFNADMVATSEPDFDSLYAMTEDGLPNLVTDAAIAAGSRLGNSSLLPGEFGRSDHVPFHEVGVPAALFIRAHLRPGNPNDYYLESLYHTPQDTLDENISQVRMQENLEIVSAAVFDLIRKQVPALEKSQIRAAPRIRR
jgi:aminopeptidase YwaD